MIEEILKLPFVAVLLIGFLSVSFVLAFILLAYEIVKKSISTMPLIAGDNWLVKLCISVVALSFLSLLLFVMLGIYLQLNSEIILAEPLLKKITSILVGSVAVMVIASIIINTQRSCRSKKH